MNIISSDGLAVNRVTLCAKGHRFNPIKTSKLFQGLISRLTTTWVAEYVKCHYSLHWINLNNRMLKSPWERTTFWQWPPSMDFGFIFLYRFSLSDGGGNMNNFRVLFPFHDQWNERKSINHSYRNSFYSRAKWIYPRIGDKMKHNSQGKRTLTKMCHSMYYVVTM